MSDEVMSDNDLVTAALTQMDESGVTFGGDDEPEAPAEEPVEPETTEETSEDEEPTEDAEKPKEEPEEPEPPRLSKALARIAKREANLLEMDTQLKAREEAVKARGAEMERISQRFAQLQEMADKDPMALLNEIGGPAFIDKLTRQLIHGEAPKQVDPQIATLQAKLDALEKQNAARQEQERRYQEQANAGVLQRAGTELTEWASKAEGIPFVTALGAKAGSEILRVTEQHWNRTKTILDKSEAARRLNDELKEQYDLLSKAASQHAAAQPQQLQGKKTPTTLTKTQRSRTAKTPDHMTDEERVAAALAQWGPETE